MPKSTLNLVLGGILAIVAVITAVHPLAMLGACVVLLVSLAATHPDEPLRPARIGLMVIAFLIPLGGPGSYLATHMEHLSLTLNKLLAFLSIAYLIWLKAVSGTPFVSNRQTRLLLWFAGVLLLSYAVNEQGIYSHKALWMYSAAMLTFFLCVNTLTRPRHIVMLLVVLMAGYLVSIGMGVSGLSSGFEPSINQQIASLYRFSGASGGNAVTFGAGTAVCLVMSVYYAVTGQKWYRVIACIAVPVFLYATVSAYARSVYIAATAGLLVLLFLLRSRIRPVHVIVGMLLISLFAVPMIDGVKFLSRIAAITADPAVDFSYGRRLSYHTLGTDLWLRSPLIGIGPGRFPELYGNEEFRFEANTFFREDRGLHNMYLSTLCHTGAAGLLVLLLLIAACFKDLLHVRRHAPADHASAEAILLALTTILLAALFNPMDTFKLIWVLFGLAAALRGIHDREAIDSPLPRNPV